MCIDSFTSLAYTNTMQYVTLQFYKLNVIISKQTFVLLCISLCSLSFCDKSLVAGLKTSSPRSLNDLEINASQIIVAKDLPGDVNGTVIMPCKRESQNQNRSCETVRNNNMNRIFEKTDHLNSKSDPFILPTIKDPRNILIHYPAPKGRKRKRKGKERKKNRIYSFSEEYRYNFGKGLNISLDMQRDIVNVNLDEDSLKEVLSGFPYEETDESEGRKKHGDKKYDMISKVLPLFLLPFLIQSAIIPFIVTKLKLLLIKSILIGKLAIFLLVISVIKNSQQMPPHEPPPAYYAWKTEHKSEVLPGYKFEEHPHAWSTR